MLRILVLATAITFSAAPATAGEANDLCGPDVTWRSVKCAFALADANSDLKVAKTQERWAKKAEIDEDHDRVQKHRNLAAWYAAEGARKKAWVIKKYTKN